MGEMSTSLSLALLAIVFLAISIVQAAVLWVEWLPTFRPEPDYRLPKAMALWSLALFCVAGIAWLAQ